MLGSFVALIVVFISLLAQVTPVVCVMRAAAAYVVFAAFGIVIRYLLADAAGQAQGEAQEASAAAFDEDLLPGSPVGKSVADLLEAEEQRNGEETAAPPT